MAISNRWVRTHIIEKLTFEQRVGEDRELVGDVDCWVDKSFRPWTTRPLAQGVKSGLVSPRIQLALERKMQGLPKLRLCC